MGVVRSERHTESDNPITVNRGMDASEPWSEITINVFDASGTPATPGGVTGVLTGSALKVGSGKLQPFQNTVNLSTQDWSWQPELSRVQEFQFSIAGLNAGFTYQITVNSWGEE